MYFKTSSSYLQDPSRLISELATTSSVDKIEGFSKAYLGFETEDPSNAFWVFEWTSKSAHDTYHQTANFKTTQAASQKVFASRPTHTFVGFSNTSRIFSAPVTEFVTFTLKRGVSMNALQPLVKQLQAKLQGTPKFYGSSWAPVVDKPNVIHGVLGWESVQAHWSAVSSGPLKEIIDEVKKIADLWLVHAVLTRYNI
jgi:heme-degrading monooxygenase HmoA